MMGCSDFEADPRPRVRLIGVTTSGHARIYTLDRRDTSSAWSATFTGDAEGVSEAFNDPDSNFVIEGKTGFKCRADMRGVTTAMDPNFLAGGKTGDRHWVWVVAGAKGARAHVDVNGDRIGRADWPAKAGNVIEVKMVERTDASTLVAFTNRCQALVYSLPALELLHTLELPYTGKTFVPLYPTLATVYLRPNFPTGRRSLPRTQLEII
jgi:syntaxin-binding protein 5